MAHQWFIEFGNQSQGPLTDSQLKTLADGGQVTPSTRIRLGVNGSWTTASSVKGLFAAASVPPPALDDVRPPLAAAAAAAPGDTGDAGDAMLAVLLLCQRLSSRCYTRVFWSVE